MQSLNLASRGENLDIRLDNRKNTVRDWSYLSFAKPPDSFRIILEAIISLMHDPLAGMSG